MEIAEHSKIKIGRLDFSQIDMEEMTPSDVYDLASLVVSEMAYLQLRLGTLEEPPRAYYPGCKFPSDVFQRVGILEAQLVELKKQITGKFH